MHIKRFDEFMNESIMGSISKLFGSGKKEEPEETPVKNMIWDLKDSGSGEDIAVEYSKSGSLHYLLGDAGRIECSVGMLQDNFSKIAKELLTKIEPVKKSLIAASEDSKPVILSFPANRNMRSAYVMFSGFSKFPNENRKYDRREYYIGKDDISTWLNYFINEYETSKVIEKKYDANSLIIRGKSYNRVDIYSLINKLSEEDVIKLKKEESIDLISSLPPVYHQYISFGIDVTEKICKDLGVVFLIGDSSNIAKSGNHEMDLNDDKLVSLLNEEFRKNPCNSIGELARLHLKLASEYKK